MILLQKSVIQEKIGTFLSLSEMYEKEEKKKTDIIRNFSSTLHQNMVKNWLK